MPITLIDGSSRANIARDLQALAASFHAVRPCYAQQLQRAAQSITDSYTPAQAVTNYTTTPTATTTATVPTFTAETIAVPDYTDSAPTDTPV